MAGGRVAPIHYDTSGYIAAMRAIMEGGRATQRGLESVGRSIGGGIASAGAAVERTRDRKAVEGQRNADRAQRQKEHQDRLGLQQNAQMMRRAEWATGEGRRLQSDIAGIDKQMSELRAYKELGIAPDDVDEQLAEWLAENEGVEVVGFQVLPGRPTEDVPEPDRRCLVVYNTQL